jgi:hypothetical protein
MPRVGCQTPASAWNWTLHRTVTRPIFPASNSMLIEPTTAAPHEQFALVPIPDPKKPTRDSAMRGREWGSSRGRL